MRTWKAAFVVCDTLISHLMAYMVAGKIFIVRPHFEWLGAYVMDILARIYYSCHSGVSLS